MMIRFGEGVLKLTGDRLLKHTVHLIDGGCIRFFVHAKTLCIVGLGDYHHACQHRVTPFQPQ
ncbi:hypothetical protein ABD68_12385 [Bacillus endophyticus]|nr:hypothetical protein [Priestia endophytica]MBG9812359.1 hypothetical protein [Priestia endophytica]